MIRRRRSRTRRALSLPSRIKRSRQRRLSLEPLEERPMMAVMTVTSLTDDTLANLLGDSQLSLREAIQAINTGANVDGIGPTSGVFGVNDEIQFNPALFAGGAQTINLKNVVSARELGLTRAMTITGPGANLLTIDAGDGTDGVFNTGDGFRIFNVDDGTATDRPAIITGLTLTGGDATSSGGAIRSAETLTVNNSLINLNATTDAGGGIQSGVAVTLNSTVVSNNNAANAGGGILSNGAAIANGSRILNNTAGGSGGGFLGNNTLNATLSTFSGNTAGSDGGGIFVNGALTLTSSTVSGNEATNNSGGIHANNTATITGSTINRNYAGNDGGGIRAASGLTINSSTISGNGANDDGGGIYAMLTLGNLTIRNSTITVNFSDDDTSGSGSGGGLYVGNGLGSVTIDQSIIAGNFDNSNVAPDIDNTTSPGAQPLTLTFSLVRNNTGSGLAAGNPDGSGNKIGSAGTPIDPMLGPLFPNGGPTETHALLAGSPAIDAGNPAFVPPPTNDQRGNTFNRVFDGAAPAGAVIDIGAYELQNLGAAQAFVVDILADENDGNYAPGDLSLREAIGLANGNVGFADTITFAPALNGGTIKLVLGDLVITDKLTINASALASGLKIDASGNDPTPGTADGKGSHVFYITDGDRTVDSRVTLTGLTLTGSDVGGLKFGGAISAAESLTIRNSLITGNAGTNGGGIQLYQYLAGALLTHEITDCTISGNSAVNGGGLYIVGGTATITNTTISGNSSSTNGGGITLLGAKTTITGSTISGNQADVDAGGLYLERGDVTIVNSTISGNRANRDGGGFVGTVGVGETIAVRYSTITANVADDDNDGSGTGGGIYLRAAGGGNGTFNLVSTIIAQNTDKTGVAPDMDATTSPPGSFNPVFNLIGIGSKSGVTNGVDGNKVGTAGVPINARLKFLADNGGSTQTHALELNSPALDAGDPSFVTPPAFDQHGTPFVRLFDGNGNGTARIDIGAFEVNAFELVAPDSFEPNDTQQTATILGSEPTVILRDLSIANFEIIKTIISDEDWFRYRAHDTGKLDVRILFRDDFGNLALEIWDKAGNLMSFANSEDDDEQLIIPVVAGEEYFIRVFGVNEDENNYALEVENFPAPAPTGVVLDPASDTGMMDNDNVTSDTTPTVLVQTDVLNFVDTNLNGLFQDPDTNPAAVADAIDALTPAEVARILNHTPTVDDDDGGISVEVTFVNTTDGTFVTGIAEAVIGNLPDVYRFTPSAPLTPGVYLVSARTRVFDGQRNAAGDPIQKTTRSNASPPLRLVIDTVGAPANSVTADMLKASDTGMRNDDNVTNKMSPAFQGIAPVGTKVRIFANAELVGQGVTGSDTSDVGHVVGGIGGLANDGLGLWEITVEPLADDGYDIRIEVEDAAGNVTEFDPRFNGPNQRIDVVIDTLEPNTPYLDLLDDTGRHDNDNITKINKPAVSMTTTDPNAALAQILFTDNLKFRIFDRYESTAGTGAPEVLIYDSAQDAVADNFMTAADMFTTFTQLTRNLPVLTPLSPAITAAGALADGVHNFKLEVEDRAGNISHDFLLEVTIDTVTPPISFGLPDLDNNSDGLTASSDTGVTTIPASFADRITSDTTPTLWGRAEADTIVRLYFDRNANGKIDLNGDPFLGQTTAIPLDGNDAYPDGYWEITSALDLNELTGVPKDGLRRLLVTAEDVAGNPMPMAGAAGTTITDGVASLHIFIDTQGPQVTDVTINDLSSDQYDLFDPKPTQHGPTPPVDSLTIHFRDLPSRVDQPDTLNDFLYAALAFDIALAPGNYRLVGDAVGVIPIESIDANNLGAAQFASTLTNVVSLEVVRDATLVGDALQPEVGDYIRFDSGAAAGQVRHIIHYNPANGQMEFDTPLLNLPAAGDAYTITKVALASVTLNFFNPLPDDRYTLTVSDHIVDLANNALDGEANPPEPQEDPHFPSGDGVPGGDFVARFTIDSRPEIGVWAAGIVHIDTNGNFYFDPENVDFTNRDLIYTLGFSSDYIFAGNFGRDADGTADGFDKLAVYGRVGNQFRFLVDFDNDGVPDESFPAPSINGLPVAGNFDGNAENGDEVAIFTGNAWYFDTNHDFIVDDGFATDYAGFPVAGDFDGDGDDDVGTYVASQAGGNQFHIDINTAGLGSAININGSADFTFRVGLPGLGTFGFPGVRERPVAADMNADGVDDLGLWVPDGTAILPGDQGEWFFLLSDVERVRDGKDVSAFGGGIIGQTVIDRIVSGGVVDFVPFSTTPFGDDLYARFGNSFALPIVGNFDPPHTTSTTSSQRAGSSTTPNTPTTPATPSVTATATPQTPVTPPSIAAPTSTPASTTSTTPTQTVAKVVVPAVTTAAASTTKAATKTTTATTKVAKKLAVPVVTTTKVKTTAPAKTPAKTAKTTVKAATPVAVSKAKAAPKVTKAATAKKVAAAPPKPVTVAKKTPVTKASKTKLATANVVTLAAAPPNVGVMSFAASIDTATLQLTKFIPPQVIEPISLTPIVSPTYSAPAIVSPEVAAPSSGSVQSSTISGTLEITLAGATISGAADTGALVDYEASRHAVFDAAFTNLQLNLADVTTNAGTIAASQSAQPSPTSAAANEQAFAQVWDSILRN